MTENVVFAFPNYADVDYYTPLLSGGDWEAALPLSNLQDRLLSKKARSAGTSEDDTRFHADLGVERDLRLVSLHAYNFSRSAAVRLRASRRIAWSGVRLASSASGGATSLSVESPGTSAMIRAGDTFTIAGTSYTATSSLALGGNRAPDSEDFTSIWWSVFLTSITVTANQAEALDGTTTADLLTESTGGSKHSISGSESSLGITGQRVTTSWFVKPSGDDRTLQVVHDWDGDSATLYFDLAAETATVAELDEDVILHDSGIESLPGGWFRIRLSTEAVDSATEFHDVELTFLQPGDETESYTGDGASGLYLWGYQLEYGPLTTYKKSGAIAAYHTTSGTVGIEPALAAGASAAAALTCVSGEYVSTPPAIDSGWFDVWPVIYDWYLPWEHPSFWDGRSSEEVRLGYPKNTHHLADSTANARYVLVEVSDTGNDDGYVELGRLVTAPGLQPGHNFTYGSQLGWKSNSQRKQSLGGADFTDRRPNQRVMSFRIEQLGPTDALEGFYEMFRRLDTDGQVYVILMPDETTHLRRVSMLATLADLTPLDFASHDRYTAYFQLEEVIA